MNALMASKAAVAVLSDERMQKTAGWTAGIILSPVILAILFICGALYGAANHNAAALDICFHKGEIPQGLPAEYRGYIGQMQSSLKWLDDEIQEIGSQMDGEAHLDAIRIKAIFYALYFGDDLPPGFDYEGFVRCFVDYENDDDGSETEDQEGLKPFPVKSLPEIYSNIQQAVQREISNEEKANASEIYHRILYGGTIPSKGLQFDSWLDSLPLSDVPFTGADGFCPPVGEGWRDKVTSEFGWRKDPFTGAGKGHGGIDFGYPKGTPVRSALAGNVSIVRYANSGFGYHVMIDHGGGVITLYAHCSKIFVTEGQQVSAGQMIAQVGSTGRSTGNHLHFEVRINGVKQNPRSFLP